MEVIIPLFLDKPFTYRVPSHLEEKAGFGKRAIVQFGKRHLYTAIILSKNTTPPKDYEAKYLIDVLDDTPIIEEKHLQFWKWISEYYMCSIGEVMDCALPAGMKIKSETAVKLHPAFEMDTIELTDREYQITEALTLQKELKISEVIAILNIKTVMPIIRDLHQKGVIVLSEELKGGYKPKIVKIIELGAEFEDDDKLQAAFEVLESKKQTAKQSNLLIHFIKLKQDRDEVAKADLLSSSGESASVLKSLVKKGILAEVEKAVDRIHFSKVDRITYVLTEAQQQAYQEIKSAHENQPVTLLHGVTSSGKTHVYADLIKDYLHQEKQVLYLVPEIALTTQLIRRLATFFGEEMGVYHSRLSENERSEMWHRVLSGDIKLVVGARSSLFLPFTNLGLTIVDEEHESSYKQVEPPPRYHARDAAIYFSVANQAKVLLGSATPSLESYHNTRIGKYALVELNKRHKDIKPPLVEIVDMKEMHFKKMMKGKLSLPLFNAIKSANKSNYQSILFQNRRGFATILECSNCSWIPQCQNCDINLTYHKYRHILNCHYCGYTIPLPKTCNACGSSDLQMKGYGTERIEDEMELLFPEAETKRMDWDTTRKKNAFDQLIRSMELGQTDILVGTQMVVKGLDFRNVKVVGILNADGLLNFPDFRSLERSFQMMTQVAGRAGRKDHQGYVLIQTHQPTHFVFDLVKRNEYKQFYLSEMQQRQAFNYPPYTRLTRIIARHRDYKQVHETALLVSKELQRQLGKNKVLGPEPPTVGRIKNKYIQHTFIKTENDPKHLHHLRSVLKNTLTHVKSMAVHRNVDLMVDIDPL